MSSEKEIRDLLPYYVKGLLSEPERRRVEEALKKDPALREELEEWRALSGAYDLLAAEERPPKDLFLRLRARLHPPRRRIRVFTLRAFPSFKTLVIIFQFLLIVFLGIKAYHPSPLHYTTLSAPVKERGELINVLFRPEAREGEIRRLLLSVGARIVDGPYPSGLYVIKVKNPGEVPRVLAVFRKSPLVTLAERASS